MIGALLILTVVLLVVFVVTRKNTAKKKHKISRWRKVYKAYLSRGKSLKYGKKGKHKLEKKRTQVRGRK